MESAWMGRVFMVPQFGVGIVTWFPALGCGGRYLTALCHGARTGAAGPWHRRRCRGRRCQTSRRSSGLLGAVGQTVLLSLWRWDGGTVVRTGRDWIRWPGNRMLRPKLTHDSAVWRRN